VTFHVILLIQRITEINYKVVYILYFCHLNCVQLSGESPVDFMIQQPQHFSHLATRQWHDLKFAQAVYIICCCEYIYILGKDTLLFSVKTETNLILICIRHKSG